MCTEVHPLPDFFHAMLLNTSACLLGMEYVGDVLVDFLGLNQSKYQWVIDMHEAEEMVSREFRHVGRPGNDTVFPWPHRRRPK